MLKVVLDTNIFVSSLFSKSGRPAMVPSAALDAKADFIVSGDRHLLDLGEYKGIPILTVQQFSERLEKQQWGTL